MSKETAGAGPGEGRVRTLVALVLVVAAMWMQGPLDNLVYSPLRRALHLPHAPAPHMLMCASYSLETAIRVAWWLLVTGVVALLDGRGILRLVRGDARQAGLLVRGLLVGLGVMVAVILAMVLVGDAKITAAPGTWWTHVKFGVGWLCAEIVGATGEELEFRLLLLVLVARLAGMWPAMIVSAAAFAYVHGANPGASKIWMLRLTAAGLLLAYAVFRTRGLGWSIGYHAGWNLGSAPLFGAAGSGYMNQGHLLSFTPSGSDLITGGAVGPEGSVFAFVAVLAATGLLVWTVPKSDAGGGDIIENGP